MKQRLDSIERVMYLREQRDSNLYRILRGEDSTTTSYFFEPVQKDNGSLIPWVASASASSDKASKQKKETASKPTEPTLRLNRSYAFFTPLKGIVTDTFDLRRNHTAVDVVSYNNAAVKATLDGTVIVSTWTPETGHIMLLQHTDNIISVYKHNSVLLKKQGAQVQAGEVIALMGNSGELTTGPHLHFELWQNGRAVNPLDYIKF
jgi:murein DD-endopeptidase MepM/ murein hydrolase activator NlpD